MERSARRRVLLDVLLMATSTVLILLVLELWVRWREQVPLLAPRNFAAELIDDGLFRRHRHTAHDPDLGWRLVDNHVGYMGGGLYELTTGEAGVRMNAREIRPVPRGGILVVGDSFAAGSEVNDAESWPAQLEVLIGEPVVNGAAGGWGADQAVLRAEQLIPVLKPHTLILEILTEMNLRNNFAMYGGGYKPYFELDGAGLRHRGQPVPHVVGTPREVGWLQSMLGYSYLVHTLMLRLDQLHWWADDARKYQRIHADRVGVEISCRLMDRLVELRDANSLRVLVVLQYGGSQYLLDSEDIWWGAPVLDCAAARGLETLDTYDVLRSIADEDVERYRSLWVLSQSGRVYGHMSPAGNAVIARLIRDRFFDGEQGTAPE